MPNSKSGVITESSIEFIKKRAKSFELIGSSKAPKRKCILIWASTETAERRATRQGRKERSKGNELRKDTGKHLVVMALVHPSHWHDYSNLI